MRVLKNEMSREYVKQEKAGADKMELEKYTLGSLRKAVFDGDTMNGSLMAGQVAGQIDKIQPIEKYLNKYMNNMRLFERNCMQIKDKVLDVPVIQGGMGVGVSLSSLAGAVAANGACGVISSVNAGYDEQDLRAAPLRRI